MDTSMARYILIIFRHYLRIVWSWGFNTPIAVENGLQFMVQGYLHTGIVQVLYNEGTDLFTVKLLNNDGSIKIVVEDIYLDCLVHVIDGMVERCEGYADRVRNSYGV